MSAITQSIICPLCQKAFLAKVNLPEVISGGEAPKPASLPAKKAATRIRGEIEKFLKFMFWIAMIGIAALFVIKKVSNNPNQYPASVSQEVRTSVVKAEEKPQDDTGAAWQGYDKNGDGVIEAWEGIEDKRKVK